MGKLTVKQEAFAHAYVETGVACEAYRQCYSASKMSQRSLEVESSRLLQHPDVSLRIEELRKAHAERHNVTVDTITEMLKEDREFAKSRGQCGPAVTATMGLAKIHGLVVDKIKGDPEAPVMVNQVQMIVVDPSGDDEQELRH